MTPLSAVVLAAGLGKRMGAGIPKVLLTAGGGRLLDHVLHAVRRAGAARIVIVEGPSSPRPSDLYHDGDLAFVVQPQRRGTAHALLQAEPLLADTTSPLLVVHGDMPLVTSASLRALSDASVRASTYGAMLVAKVAGEGYAGLGRVIVKDGVVVKIVEARDLPARHAELLALDPDLDRTPSINVGGYLFGSAPSARARPGEPWNTLREVGCDNAQHEHYLPDVVPLLAGKGLAMGALYVDAEEGLGVNTQDELAGVEAILKGRDGAGSSPNVA